MKLTAQLFGSGPADLARSIAWDALGREPHPAAYQHLKNRVVAAHAKRFKITEDEVRSILAEAARRTHESDATRIAYRCDVSGALLSYAEADKAARAAEGV
jgi:hypothetical protein